MSNFIPDQPREAKVVPWFEDATREEGFQGYSTQKSISTLKSEIVMAVSRLGGQVIGFQQGKFRTDNRDRMGYRVTYNIESADGKLIPGRIDIAALPVKPLPSSSYGSRCDKSLRMALYMLRDAFDGLWYLQILSPGYAPLMPFMLAKDGKTITELWSESSAMGNLLPPGDTDFIDGEFQEGKHG